MQMLNSENNLSYAIAFASIVLLSEVKISEDRENLSPLMDVRSGESRKLKRAPFVSKCFAIKELKLGREMIR